MENKSYLYQYTSLETLALILKNKNIRFTKLRLLDDPLEKYVHLISLTDRGVRAERKDYGGFCFVSCWTKSNEESIAMWDMYGDRKRGVRICFPEDMFDSNFNIYGNTGNKTKALLTVDSSSSPIPKLIVIDYKKIDEFTMLKWDTRLTIDGLGRFKIPDWSFQNECRFRLFASNEKNKGNVYFASPEFALRKQIKFRQPISKNGIYFKLKDSAFDQIQITVGPEISEGSRLLLESLIEKYNINKDRVVNSKFTDE